MIFLHRFSESITIAIAVKFLAATCCSLLQQPSLSRAPHLSNSPSPKSQVPSPKSQVPSPKSQVPSPKSQVPSPNTSPKSQVPSPKSQVPSPKSQVQEAGKLWMPWCRWSPLVLHQQPGPHSYILLHRGTKLTVVLHMAADRSGSNRILEADWL